MCSMKMMFKRFPQLQTVTPTIATTASEPVVATTSGPSQEEKVALPLFGKQRRMVTLDVVIRDVASLSIYVIHTSVTDRCHLGLIVFRTSPP